MSDAAIKPDFGHVCQLAEAGLYSMVVMVPLWFVVGVLGLMGVARERTQMKVARGEEEGKY